ncbi:MAG: hypothetical protein R3B13_38910 [Polyangiaceae bacterium]
MTTPLGDLCRAGGLFRGPIFKRIYAKDAEHGVAYVSAKDLVKAEVRPSSYLSNHLGGLLEQLRLREGMILITCSGMNLGSVIWVRRDLDGLCGTHDLIRVVPDRDKIPAGYLYAFLASRYGNAWIRKHIYGGNIKHVEPHHLTRLPVLRLPDRVELRIDELITSASQHRAKSSDCMQIAWDAMTATFELQDLSESSVSTDFATFSVRSRMLQRLDAAHHHPACTKAQAEFHDCWTRSVALAEVAGVFTPGIFKRPHVDDPASGYAYFSGSELFQIDPEPRGYLSKRAPGIEAYLVEKDWLLIQDAGQLGGLIGRITRVGAQVSGGVVSNHLVRVVPRSQEEAGYLFAVLTSPHGYRCITRLAFGTSIPQLDPQHIASVRIPWPPKDLRARISHPVMEGWRSKESAACAEREAVLLVERAVEEAV